MISFDKAAIKESLTLENIYQLLEEWGASPIYTNFGIMSQTICHNLPGEGSYKLYFYSNSFLFHCYTGCPEGTFDIFELVRKVACLQWNKEFDLNDAVRWVAYYFGILTELKQTKEELEDWKIFSKYSKIKNIESADYSDIKLKVYDDSILEKLNYTLRLDPWIKENISEEVLKRAKIGFYPGEDQITIPHYNIDNELIGIRGRTLCAEDAKKYGKYRPLRLNGCLYNHPLGFNLYGLNWNKNAIKTFKKAIVVESEKSVLQYGTAFGWENNIAVACCGSNLTAFQAHLLLSFGVEEIILGFDRQFQDNSKEDKEFMMLKNKLLKLRNKYKNFTKISFIFDKNKITPYKASPLDCGKEIFLTLFKERIIL